MSHARVEEVSDSDPDTPTGSDPDEADIQDVVADADIMLRRAPRPAPAAAAARRQRDDDDDDTAAYRRFQALYPVYFDATRSRAQGRRVAAALAVRNPLAREVAAACSRLGLRTLLEPYKMHPKDWANPGRVKVDVGASAAVNNKHHLYLLVAKHLQLHPTTDRSPGLRSGLPDQLQPPADAPYPRPAVPRGWRMGDLLPCLSAAMTGGGVSENLFKDMMREMQAGADPVAALMAGHQQPAAGSQEAG